MYIYQCETNIYKNLNYASRFRNKAKLKALGPYGAALYWAVRMAQYDRKDFDRSKINKDTILYRGGGMTKEEIKEYKQNIDEAVQLFGYTSTSLRRDIGTKFMWDNSDAGVTKVLF